MSSASIQKIDKIEKVENADTLDKLSILGWQVVSKQGQFKEGDLCVFIEIDSIVPDRPEFEFLKSKGFRVKTIKLRGELSQGLVIPISILMEVKPEAGYNIGDDVSSLLGVTHYEKPVSVIMNGETKCLFPDYVPKTDEERLQSNLGLLKEIEGKDIIITCKYDGTSATYIHNNGEEHVCSRNRSLKEGNSIYFQINKKYAIIDNLRKLGNYAIQGEIVGPGIQGNKLKLKEIDFYVFDVYDINNKFYVEDGHMRIICEDLGLKCVDFINSIICYTRYISIQLYDLLKLAERVYPGTIIPMEGIVVRLLDGGYSNILRRRLSFKVINNNYLLKHGE